MPAKRLLIADDHPIIREGITLAVRGSLPDFAVDAAGDIAEAEAFLGQESGGYRLVLLDFVLPDARGFSGFLKLQHLAPRVPIVIISASGRPELVSAAKALGAAGYLSKSLPLDKLMASLRKVLAGEMVFPPDVAASDIARTRERIADLSGAQLRVLLALADGRLNKQIAGDLGVTEATIKAHMSAIFRKLGVNNRTQAILAMQPLLGEQADSPA